MCDPAPERRRQRLTSAGRITILESCTKVIFLPRKYLRV